MVTLGVPVITNAFIVLEYCPVTPSGSPSITMVGGVT